MVGVALDDAPWLLAEGVLIAAGLRDSNTIELCLPADLQGHEAALLNAVDAIRSLARIATPGRQVEVHRNCTPGCWGEGDVPRPLTAGPHPRDVVPDRSTVRRRPQPRRVVADAAAWHEAAWPGRVDLVRPAAAPDRGLGGGVEVQGGDAVLVFDDGLGGFLPLSGADVSREPLWFAQRASSRCRPRSWSWPRASASSSKQDGRCIGTGNSPKAKRNGCGPLARAARLVTEITLGRGAPDHLVALDEIAIELTTQGLAGAWPLGSALRYYRDQWEQHARRESCPEGLCLQRKAAPCHSTCPANIDIPSFVAHLGHGDYRSTIEVIRRDNPLPLTCGLVCPAPCESACVRGGSNGAVFIRPLKAKAAEHCLANGGYPKPDIAPDTGRRIGIVGSGPAGLTAAYYLRTFGHHVEIVESQEKAGGMLRYGIPAYRLPPELLDQELDQIQVLGIPIRTNTRVDDLDAFRKDYDAVFLGLGTQKSRPLIIDGVQQPFVLGGIDFLRSVHSAEPVRVGPRSSSSAAATSPSTSPSPRCARAPNTSTWSAWRNAARCRRVHTRSRTQSPKECNCTRAGARSASTTTAPSPSSSANGPTTTTATSIRRSTPADCSRSKVIM